MAAAIDATIGGASANSYATVAQADAYFDERVPAVSSWSAATADEKIRALIQATRRLDILDWIGWRVADSQALRWPRNGVAVQDGDDHYQNNEIPVPLQHATFEQAEVFLAAGSTDTAANVGLEGFDKIKVGPIELEINHADGTGELTDHVDRLLRHMLELGGGNTVRLGRA